VRDARVNPRSLDAAVGGDRRRVAVSEARSWDVAIRGPARAARM